MDGFTVGSSITTEKKRQNLIDFAFQSIFGKSFSYQVNSFLRMQIFSRTQMLERQKLNCQRSLPWSRIRNRWGQLKKIDNLKKVGK